MLKRVNRLKSRGDFKKTLAGRRLCANDCFVMYGLLSPPSQAGSFGVKNPRIGFIVSKKVHKRSNRRNRIRRRLRELFRTYLLTERRELLGQFRTIVVIARAGSLEASYVDLKSRMERFFLAVEKAEKRC